MPALGAVAALVVPPAATAANPAQGTTAFTLGDATPSAGSGLAQDATAATTTNTTTAAATHKHTVKPAQASTSQAAPNAAQTPDSAATAAQQAVPTPWSWLLSLLGQSDTAVSSGGKSAAVQDARAPSAESLPRATSDSPLTALDAAAVNAATGAVPVAIVSAPLAATTPADLSELSVTPPSHAVSADSNRAMPRVETPTTTQAQAAEAVPAIPQDAHGAGLPAFERVLADTSSTTPVSTSAPSGAQSLPDNQSAWPDLLADQVRWQVGHQVQEARLDLHPRDLGSVQVQLRLSGGSLDVQFSAAHPQAREALAAALPQLRALLADGGVQLAQAQVGSQSQAFQPPRPMQRREAGSAVANDDEQTPAVQLRVLRIGLVDDFA